MTTRSVSRQSRVLAIEPTGGLCNRLRALDSALAYAESHGRALVVIWIPTPACNSRFTQLFEVPVAFRRLVELDTPWEVAAFRRLVMLAFMLRPAQRIDHAKIIASKRRVGSYFEGIRGELRKVQDRRIVFVRSFNRFQYASDSHPYKSFVPRANLQELIDKYDTRQRVGVHVRRTDNEKSIRAGSLDRFVALMRSEIDVDPHVTFFVATDDPPSEDALRVEFPTRIVAHSKRSLDRNDPLAVQDAVIDLYCLAGCRKLIGSYWSSFSEAAYEMHGIPHIVVGPEKP